MKSTCCKNIGFMHEAFAMIGFATAIVLAYHFRPANIYMIALRATLRIIHQRAAVFFPRQLM